MRLCLFGLLAVIAATATVRAENKFLRGEPTPLPVKLDKNYKVGKIDEYLFDRKQDGDIIDRSLAFDRKYYSYGVITRRQRHEATGQYFTVHWNAQVPSNVTVRFEYRQEKTRDEIFRLEVPYDNVQGAQATHFDIVGDAFDFQGKVISWRALIIRDGWVVAERKSLVW